MPEPAATDRLVHTARIAVRWGDMDAFGHVNNAVYFRYFEQARIEALDRALGGDWPEGAGPILAATSAEFRRPLRFPATALVRVSVGDPGRTSFRQRFELRVEGEGDEPFATGDARLVWVDAKTGQPIPLPDAIRATLPDPEPA